MASEKVLSVLLLTESGHAHRASLQFNILGIVMTIAGIVHSEQTEHQVWRVRAQCIVLGGPDAEVE